MVLAYEPKKAKTTNVTMKIITTEDIPIYHHPRRLPFIEREIVDKQVQEWINDGIIESCTSQYASQVVIVKKKDGSHRGGDSEEKRWIPQTMHRLQEIE
ncbi:Reverse transcriptase (RNA-dependent DNA polymerase) [Popillia japonica]|uniref:Reverse transcriptase (RNA-dependent DNA polymerase) n=1 Tax=Popillia japonica TaxID=7064 RepID=A0AAW1LRF3_POPJA